MGERQAGISLRFIPHQVSQPHHGVSMPFHRQANVPGQHSGMSSGAARCADGRKRTDYVPQYVTKSSAVISAPPMPASNAKQKMTTLVLAQDVNLVKAKRPEPKPTVSHSSKPKKPTKYLRTAGGQVWEDVSLGEWDNNDFRLFCGDLGNEVSDDLLEKAFRKYPSFVRAKVVRDRRSNKTKGYGFISFKDPQDFIRAMREMDGKYVGNRPIKLRKSTWKDRSVDSVRKKAKERRNLGFTL